MVDEERVVRLLRRLEADLRYLDGRAAGDRDEILSDPTVLAAVKYYFATAIEGCARVAHHLAASEGWPVGESNADAIMALAREHVLDHSLATALARAVGFRNLLVHEYADVDDALTVGHLDDLDDLRRFTEQVLAWLARAG